MSVPDPTEHAPGYDTHERPPGSVSRFDGALPLTVVLVRHGVTPMTETGMYSGSDVPGPPLSTRGQGQAAQAADAVFRIGRGKQRALWPDVPRPGEVIASPMIRAQETAGAVGRRLGLPVTVDKQFAECRFGDWEGLTAAQIEAAWPGELHLWHSTGTFVPPRGESYAQLGGRVWDGMQALVDGGVGRTVVVVGHAAQIRTAVGQAMGAPASHWSRLRIPPASLSLLRLWADGASEVTTVGFPTDA